MKLLKAYINAYGNIEDKEFDFSSGLNSICEDNGYGKSTLASFIRASFYGLEKKTKNYFERDRALPYSKKPCGGYLIFEFNGKEYKIQRSFSKKAQEDELHVFVNGIETNELGPVPGETIFGLDLDSFNKTIFINPIDLTVSTNESLNAKMGHFVEDSKDSFDFEEAKEKLDKRKRELKPIKSQDSKGLIAEKKIQIDDLDNKNENLKSLRLAMGEKYEKEEKLNISIQEMNKKLTDASNHNAELEAWDRYDEYNNTIQHAKNEIDGIRNKYPNGIPSKEELANFELLLNQKDKKIFERNATNLSKHEEEEYSSLSLHFKDKTPNEEDLTKLKETYNKYLSLKNQGEISLDDSEKKLIEEYSGKTLDTEELRKRIKNYQDLDYDPDPRFVGSDYGYYFSSPARIILYSLLGLVLGILLIIVIVLTVKFAIEYVYWIVGAAVVFICALTTFVIWRGRKKEKEKHVSIVMEHDKKKFAILEEINNMLAPFGKTLSQADNLDLESFQIINKYETYCKAKDKETKILNDKKASIDSLNNIKNSLGSYFSSFAYIGDIEDIYYTFFSDLEKYSSLSKKKLENDNKRKSIDQEIENIDRSISSFRKKYNVEIDNKTFIQECRDDRKTIDLKEKYLGSTEEKLKNYISEKKLVARPTSNEKVNVLELTEELSKLNKDYQTAAKDIDDSEREISSLESEVEQLPLLNEEWKELKDEHFIVSKTITYLSEAEINLKNRYIKPVKDKFDYYSSILSEAFGKKVVMDADFNIKIIEEGIERDYHHLSTGQLTLCVFCYRLAIMDNIFPKDKPLLILDDLFVNLDEKHLSLAKKLIDLLAKDRQIFYYTCHKSRDLE